MSLAGVFKDCHELLTARLPGGLFDMRLLLLACKPGQDAGVMHTRDDNMILIP
jgi:hypothetical protein